MVQGNEMYVGDGAEGVPRGRDDCSGRGAWKCGAGVIVIVVIGVIIVPRVFA
jgi:hypothetical protein